MIGAVPRIGITSRQRWLPALPSNVTSLPSLGHSRGAFVYETHHMGVVYSYIATLANKCRVKDVSGCDLLSHCVGRARSSEHAVPLFRFTQHLGAPPSYSFTSVACMPSPVHPCQNILPPRLSRPSTHRINLAQSECGQKRLGYTSPSTSASA